MNATNLRATNEKSSAVQPYEIFVWLRSHAKLGEQQ